MHSSGSCCCWSCVGKDDGSCNSRKCGLVEAVQNHALQRSNFFVHSCVAQQEVCARVSGCGCSRQSLFVLCIGRKTSSCVVASGVAFVCAGEQAALPFCCFFFSFFFENNLHFGQRYKQDITVEQKNAFRGLLRRKKHHLITPEIRRELFQSASRDERDKIAGGEMEDEDEDARPMDQSSE